MYQDWYKKFKGRNALDFFYLINNLPFFLEIYWNNSHWYLRQKLQLFLSLCLGFEY